MIITYAYWCENMFGSEQHFCSEEKYNIGASIDIDGSFYTITDYAVEVKEA